MWGGTALIALALIFTGLYFIFIPGFPLPTVILTVAFSLPCHSWPGSCLSPLLSGTRPEDQEVRPTPLTVTTDSDTSNDRVESICRVLQYTAGHETFLRPHRSLFGRVRDQPLGTLMATMQVTIADVIWRHAGVRRGRKLDSH